MDLKNHSMIAALQQMAQTDIPDIRAWALELQDLLDFLKKHFPDVGGEVHPRPDSLGEGTNATLTLWPTAWFTRRTQILQVSLSGDKAKAEGPHLPPCWVHGLEDLQSKASAMMLNTSFQLFLMECRRLNTSPTSAVIEYSAGLRGRVHLPVVLDGNDIWPIATAAEGDVLSIEVSASSDFKEQELDQMEGGTMTPYDPHTRAFKVEILEADLSDNPRILNLVVRRV